MIDEGKIDAGSAAEGGSTPGLRGTWLATSGVGKNANLTNSENATTCDRRHSAFVLLAVFRTSRDNEERMSGNSITKNGCREQFDSSFLAMEEAMTTHKFRPLTFVISLAAVVATSASAGAQPAYKHKAHANQFASIPWTATAFAPSPAAAVRTHETYGLSRDADDCVKYGCIDH